MAGAAAETSLVRYDAMCHAISVCYEVDEVKEIHDKALAMELYARQAMNIEAERKACEVRLRAERRAGELLAEKEKAAIPNATGKNQHVVAGNGGRQPRSDYAETLGTAGIAERCARASFSSPAGAPLCRGPGRIRGTFFLPSPGLVATPQRPVPRGFLMARKHD